MSPHQLSRRYVRFIMTFTAGLLLLALPGWGQTATGNIYGIVTDNSGAALPGVTVNINGGGLQQTFVTEEGGEFHFLRLPPGRYRVTATLEGLGAVQRDADVSIGTNSTVNLSIAPQLSETMIVEAAVPVIDARETGTGEVVTQEEIEKLPTARDPWVMLQQMPGVLVDRVNVGGNKSGQQSYFISKGVERHQTQWNIDGVNVTEMDETGTSTFYYDFGSLQEFQVITSTADPSVRTPGVQINMVTKRGTNDFSGSARAFWADEEWQSEASGPASLREGNRVDNVTELGADFSGPIIADRLWFYGAYSENDIANITSSWLFPQRTELTNWTAKLNAQPAMSNSATAYYMFSDKTVNARGLSDTRPPETARRQSGPGWVAKLEDTHIFSNNFVLTGMFGRVDSGYKQEPRGGMDVDPYWLDGDIDFNGNGNIELGEMGGWHRSYSMSEQILEQNNYRADASTFFRTGGISHELKVGGGYRDQDTEWWVIWPGNQVWTEFYDDGTLVAAFTRSAHPIYTGEYTDFYVGDTLTWNNLTVQGGFRYDLQRAFNRPSDVPANPLIPDVLIATSYAGDERKLEWETITPKIGMTYQLGTERRTVFRASYSRYADQLGASDAGANNPFYDYQTLYYYWSDDNGDGAMQLGEIPDLGAPDYTSNIDPANLGGGGESVGRIDYDNHDPTTTDEWILGAEHQLTPYWSAGITYTHRLRQNFVWDQYEKTQGGGDFYTAADYELAPTPLTGNVPDGSGTYSIPYYRLRSGVARPLYYATRNRPDYEQTYDGLELTTTRRADKWMLRAQVTLSDWKQHVGAAGIQNPSPLLEGDGCYTCDDSPVASSSGSDGYINSRWAYSISGLYDAPLGINLGVVITGREGYINGYNRRFRTDGANRRYVINDFEDYRFPNLFQLDLRAAKQFALPAGFNFEVSLDAFNVTNERTILWRDYETAVIEEMQSPRIVRLGGKFTF